MKIKNYITKLYPIFVLALGLVICLTLIFTKPVAKPQVIKKIPPIVKTKNLTSQSVVINIESQGTVIPRTESQIFPEISGKVIHVSSKLDEGSSFKKGDILLKIDSRDYELAIKSAEANLAAAKTQYSIAQAESESAKEEWDKLGKGEATDLTLKKPQLEQAKSAVEAAEADLERLKRNLEKTDIKAPYDGLVRKKYVDIGTVIAPGYLIANIYATDYFEVKLPISDDELAFIEIPMDGSDIGVDKQPKVVLTGTFGGKSTLWEGSIVRIESEIDPKSRMATLIARVSDPYNTSLHSSYLRIGQYVNAKISGKKYNNLFQIDREFLRDGNSVVLINRSDSTLIFQKVSILRFVNDRALIYKGLKNNSLMCLTSLDIMYDGMKIQLK